jgi:hypothetical protein
LLFTHSEVKPHAAVVAGDGRVFWENVRRFSVFSLSWPGWRLPWWLQVPLPLAFRDLTTVTITPFGRVRKCCMRVGLPFVVALVCAPSVASGGCGDEVFHLQHPSVTSLGLGSLAEARTAQLPKHHLPCNGPNCGGRQQPMTPPAAPAPVFGSPDWACLVAIPSHIDGSYNARLADEFSREPLRRNTSIYNPPRS